MPLLVLNNTMQQHKQLKVVGMVYNQKLQGTYSLILADATDDFKRFSILIGESEAQSIALKIHKKRASRPLTHDLIVNLFYEFNTSLEKVVIYKMQNDVFYSELYLRNEKNELIKIDSRTSDAVAIATRIDVPIFIKTEIWNKIEEEFEKKFIQFEKKNIKETLKQLNKNSSNAKKELESMNKKELNELLEVALDTESYELAVQIRDEIKNRK